tara:strand:- start:152 stop:655 length:504 start_codon:yes stop_codon:yes gene_type:complete
MKKFLGIVVLGLLLSTNTYSSSDLMVPGSNYPGLEGLKEFNLKIDSTVYEGSEMVCDISYEEIESLVKNTIESKSEIWFSDKFGAEQFELKTNIIIKDNICSSQINLTTFSWENGRNTAGTIFKGPHVSFYDNGKIFVDKRQSFKNNYLNLLEKYLLNFLIHWQKYN